MRKPEQLTELRCAQCGKLLARGDGTLQIKYPRCKSFNSFHCLAQHSPNANERQEILTHGNR
ncbi:MAG: Com family DNA-binding transcriptional regulator [Azoarcus sp.]|nr:Com family DNA-binding transcriptional regulator [Azoarcus sp.]